MPRKKKTTFILDTNVILHDSACIYQFAENNVVIPVTVLEELDQFKKGSEILNFHARAFVRTLDLLCGEHLFNGGVAIGPGLGKITVKLDRRRYLLFRQGKLIIRILQFWPYLLRASLQKTVLLI